MGLESMVQPVLCDFHFNAGGKKSTLIIVFTNKDDVMLIVYFPEHSTESPVHLVYV